VPSVEPPRARYDARLCGVVSEEPPIGAVVERDGALVRTHYGTVDHRTLPESGLDGLIVGQREAFAARDEPVTWTIYAHDTPADLPVRLLTAGFTPGRERAVLVAPSSRPRPRRRPPCARRSRPSNGNTSPGSPWTRLPQRRAHPDFLVVGRHMFWDTWQLF
jgi:hypothetical protein